MNLLNDSASSHKAGSVTSFLWTGGLCSRTPALFPRASPPVTFSCTLVSRKSLLLETIHPTIMKTYLYNFDPLKPHFYIVKLGFTGVHNIFLISAQKHRLWNSLEPPRRGGSNEYPQSMFWVEIWKYQNLYLKKFSFLAVNFSIYLNRCVFVMPKVGSRHI